ncbi:O-antigen ligase [Arthrobacter sp. B2I5]|uniref:O-antigen ligase family protein n=1 Tax=Arthrobacter sp. B2I5 TaxID=3042266 RepID=UPI00278216B4|nr:O-antigen ligase family protein [Arthrobacter sp. B2I5]MDQ0824657.1 O-antigen ligase [Arthrobacter sp. B2I5]
MGNPSDRIQFHNAKLLMPAMIAVLAALVYVAVSSVLLLAAVLGLAVYSVILYKAGLWRTMVGTSLLVSVLRSGPTSALLSETGWYILQFGPIVLAGIALLPKKPGRIRDSDRAVVLFMILFAVIALATNLTTLAPSATLPQSILLAGMTTFLLLTFVRRWSGPSDLRGDVSMVFLLITMVQIVGVVAVLAGQAWPVDPDYGRFRGMYSNANYAGMMSAIGIAGGVYLFRASKRRILVLASMAVLTAAMLLSGSRGALLAVVIAVLILMLSGTQRTLILPLAVLGGLFFVFAMVIDPQLLEPLDRFFLRDGSSPDVTSGRLQIYQQLLDMFQKSPLTGTGYRSIEEVKPGAPGLAAHNIYLSILTETGLFGAFIFVALGLSVLAASRLENSARPLLVVVVTIAVVELTESSIYGWGGPSALTAWMLILAFAANGRFRSEETVSTGETAANGVATSAATRSRDL